MTVAEYIVHFLAARRVTHVFELSGGMITPLLDAVARFQTDGGTLLAPTLINMRHEQAAGFAAEGWARMTPGVPGVAFATSGPGATNLLTAIASCYYDSTPAVFITGNVSTKDYAQGAGRQRGFQETAITMMARPVTKAAWRVNVDSIVTDLALAFEMATDARPGPVLLDIPFDVLRAEIPSDVMTEVAGEPPHRAIDPKWIDRTIEILRGANRPLVLVGGGVRQSGAIDDVRRLIDHLWLPVVHSLQGIDVTYFGHPKRVGMIGSYGNRWANWTLAYSDAVLVLGSRLDIRQTGADVDAFIRGKKIVHVDIDSTENRVPASVYVPADVGTFARALVAATHPRATPTGWQAEITNAEKRWPDVAESNALPGTVNPNALMQAIGDAFPKAAAFVLDVGAHQMWAAQSLRFGSGQRVITSGGLGAMGFALPAAIGACLAAERREVVVITGDASLQVNIQELATIWERDLPIKIIVLDNGGHGMVRQFQREVFRREVATSLGSPRFDEIARAYGIRSNVMTDVNTSMLEGMASIANVMDHPKLLVVPIHPSTGVYPKLVYGRTLDDMEGAP